MRLKNTIGLIIFALIFAGLTVRCVIIGVVGLNNSEFTKPSINSESGKLCEMRIIGADEVYTIERKLLYYIPIGTERFYLCDGEDGKAPLLVKASKSWYEKNFDMYGFAKQPMTLTGEVRDFEYERRGDINRIDDALPNAVPGRDRISGSSYLSLTYKRKYILEIVSALVNVAAAAVVIVTVKKQKGEVFGIVLGAAALLFTVFMVLCADML